MPTLPTLGIIKFLSFYWKFAKSVVDLRCSDHTQKKHSLCEEMC